MKIKTDVISFLSIGFNPWISFQLILGYSFFTARNPNMVILCSLILSTFFYNYFHQSFMSGYVANSLIFNFNTFFHSNLSSDIHSFTYPINLWVQLIINIHHACIISSSCNVINYNRCCEGTTPETNAFILWAELMGFYYFI